MSEKISLDSSEVEAIVRHYLLIIHYFLAIINRSLILIRMTWMVIWMKIRFLLLDLR